jgi:molybdopterin-guanine dinucleotide biosynthesis protein
MPIDIVRVTRQLAADASAEDSEAQVALAEATAAEAKEAVSARRDYLIAEGFTTEAKIGEIVLGDPTWDSYGERGRLRCTVQAHVTYDEQ